MTAADDARSDLRFWTRRKAEVSEELDRIRVKVQEARSKLQATDKKPAGSKKVKRKIAP